MFPTNAVPAPIVALPPTCQNTLDPLHVWVPPTATPVVLDSAPPIRKIHGPAPVRVSGAPDNCASASKQYTPGARFCPPRSWPVRLVPHVMPSRSSYTSAASNRDWAATASPAWVELPAASVIGSPITCPPGPTPTSPVTLVTPELVTVDPARTAKLSAEPRLGVCAKAAAGVSATAKKPDTVAAQDIPPKNVTIVR